MKWIVLILILVVGCGKVDRTAPVEEVFTDEEYDTVVKLPPDAKLLHMNERFRDVSVEKLADGKYRISGEGQIFEASFGWVIEDGHNELKKGFATTDAGAPEWGKFDFTIDAVKQQENSTLTLILFETSAKDGSRQHELMVPLE